MNIDELLNDSQPAEADTAKPVKKKCKPRGGNSPVIGNNGLMTEAGDTAKYLTLNSTLLKLPNIDMSDVEAVQTRLSEYFDLHIKADIKPTVSGMALALNGHNRRWLWAVVNDTALSGHGNKCTLPTSVTDTIKKAYFSLETLWENYMQNGKINPVSGIFLGKNNYGYQDKVEHVITPNSNPEEVYSTEDIRARYSTQEQLTTTTDDDES